MRASEVSHNNLRQTCSYLTYILGHFKLQFDYKNQISYSPLISDDYGDKISLDQ